MTACAISGACGPDAEELQNASRSFLNSGNPFRANAKWGLIDASGNWIREPEFSDICGLRSRTIPN